MSHSVLQPGKGRWQIRLCDLAWILTAFALVGVIWHLQRSAFVARASPVEAPVDLNRFQLATILPSKPALLDPPHGSADAADVLPTELVLGVVLNGEARAYPLNMLSGPIREILNDTLGGEPVAVTWCDFCHDGIVYSRRVVDQVLTLFVAGSMWEQSMVIADEQTGSLWSQVLGRAMRGDMAGQTLEILPSVNTTWADWKHRFPNTTVVALPRERTDYTRHYHRDRRKFVLGLRNGSRSAHVTFQTLAASRVLNVDVAAAPLVVTYDDEHSAARVYSRVVNRSTLEFLPSVGNQMHDRQTGSVWDAGSGVCQKGQYAGTQLQPRPGLVAYTFVWRRFHPESLDLGAGNASPSP